MHKIGIGITTRNRRDIFTESYKNWVKMMPKGSRVVVVDDASSVPVNRSDFRFERQAGIARAKNKCIELLDDCDSIFLVDDDIYPIVKEWYKPYVESGMNHMCLSFEHNSKGERLSNSVFVKMKIGGISVYNSPNGCMIYVKKRCIDKIGGMNCDFGIWGNEHVEFSRRIYNSGLTPFPFMDVNDSINMFHVHDYYGDIESSVPEKVRVDSIRDNQKLLTERMESKEFIQYKELKPLTER